MNLIIDANIIFASLIKDGATRKLLVNEDIRLYAPEFILIEIEKYSDEICLKSGKTLEELKKVLKVLEKRITVVPDKELICKKNLSRPEGCSICSTMFETEMCSVDKR